MGTINRVDGRTLAKRLLADQADLPLILMSDQSDSMDLASQPTMCFLPKPFDLPTLLSTVRRLVSEGKSVSMT